MFHVSFLCFNLLIINAFKRWNIQFQCFTFSFNISVQKNTVGAIQKHCGRDSKTLRERFKNTEGAMKRSLSVLKNETWNLKWKMKVLCFTFLNSWYSSYYKEKWNMKDKTKFLQTYRDCSFLVYAWLKKVSFIWQFSENAVILHSYSREALLFTPKFGVWCNGNTADSGPAFSGSSPDTPTIFFYLAQSNFYQFGCVFYFVVLWIFVPQ